MSTDVTALAKEAEPQSAYAVIDGQVRQFAAKLGVPIEAEASIWEILADRQISRPAAAVFT